MRLPLSLALLFAVLLTPVHAGVLMIGKDRDGTEVWMKGWIDADGIGVAYVFADQMPAISWTEAVLQGFRFPGD